MCETLSAVPALMLLFQNYVSSSFMRNMEETGIVSTRPEEIREWRDSSLQIVKGLLYGRGKKLIFSVKTI